MGDNHETKNSGKGRVYKKVGKWLQVGNFPLWGICSPLVKNASGGNSPIVVQSLQVAVIEEPSLSVAPLVPYVMRILARKGIGNEVTYIPLVAFLQE